MLRPAVLCVSVVLLAVAAALRAAATAAATALRASAARFGGGTSPRAPLPSPAPGRPAQEHSAGLPSATTARGARSGAAGRRLRAAPATPATYPESWVEAAVTGEEPPADGRRASGPIRPVLAGRGLATSSCRAPAPPQATVMPSRSAVGGGLSPPPLPNSPSPRLPCSASQSGRAHGRSARPLAGAPPSRTSPGQAVGGPRPPAPPGKGAAALTRRSLPSLAALLSRPGLVGPRFAPLRA